MSNLNASYTGTWDAEAEAWVGTFTQGADLPLTLERGLPDAAPEASAAPERVRPQTPMPPFGYLAENVAFDNPLTDGIRLAGTLTLPAGDGPFPAAVLLSGAGPGDRDASALGHKPMMVLADHLTRNGIAILRYDDRGAGQSTGDFAAATWEDFAGDLGAAADFLRTRPDIRADAIGLVGHSEGGVIAPMAAAEDSGIAFIVMIAAPAKPFGETMQTQQRRAGLAQGRPAVDVERAIALQSAVLAAIAGAPDKAQAQAAAREILNPEALAATGVPETARDALIDQLTSDWMLYALNYDPAVTLTTIEAPVLAIGGSLDQQVPAAENLPTIEAALADNPDATVVTLQGLNHFMQTAVPGAPPEFGEIAETFAPVALQTISDWINARF